MGEPPNRPWAMFPVRFLPAPGSSWTGVTWCISLQSFSDIPGILQTIESRLLYPRDGSIICCYVVAQIKTSGFAVEPDVFFMSFRFPAFSERAHCNAPLRDNFDTHRYPAPILRVKFITAYCSDAQLVKPSSGIFTLTDRFDRLSH